ncbi:MAG: polyphosphate polymerase domain-containing protein [Bacteroidia bacterium]|nr:polyphosphate polymerase domain-containing protein [Bacteroidia bacterium]
MEQELRYERKFYVTGTPLPDMLHVIRIHRALFSEIFHQRQINNIYFDSPGFESYFDNMDGAYHRIKARIRWYGETFGLAKKPTLEFKIKKGLLGFKRNFVLPDLVVDTNITKDKLLELMLGAVDDEHLRSYLHKVNPVLLNVYTRKYFITADKKIRLTIDTGLHYYSIMNEGSLFISPVKDDKGIVIEMKYDKDTELLADRISSEFPFLMTKNSKYLQGVSRVLGLEL